MITTQNPRAICARYVTTAPTVRQVSEVIHQFRTCLSVTLRRYAAGISFLHSEATPTFFQSFEIHFKTPDLAVSAVTDLAVFVTVKYARKYTERFDIHADNQTIPTVTSRVVIPYESQDTHLSNGISGRAFALHRFCGDQRQTSEVGIAFNGHLRKHPAERAVFFKGTYTRYPEC